MEPLDDTTPFMTLGAIPAPQRLSRVKIYGLLGGLAAVLLGMLFVPFQRWWTGQSLTPPAPVVEATPPMTTAPPPLENFIKVPTSFAGVDRRPPPDLPPPPPPPGPLPPLFPPDPPPPPPPPRATEPPLDTGKPPPTTETPHAAVPPPAPAQKPPPPRWFGQSGQVGKSPFGEPKKPVHASAPEGDNGKGGSLIKDAVLEKPAHIERTWYRSQALHGLTTTVIESQLGGTVVIRVTRALEDKFLQGVEIIPQQALILAKNDATPRYGDNRLDIVLEQIEYPSGEILGLKAKASDFAGAQGLSGTVDNRWGHIIAGAGLSALLSIGTRFPAGNQGHDYGPTLAQQTAQDASRSITQAGNAVVQRELDVKPRITVPVGTVVTIYPNENLSLAQPARVVR